MYNINHFGTWILYFQLYAGQLHESRNHSFFHWYISNIWFLFRLSPLSRRPLTSPSLPPSTSLVKTNMQIIYLHMISLFIYYKDTYYICVCVYIHRYTHIYSLWALTINNLPAMQKTWVQSLGQEDSLEKEMATHSSILAWRIPRTEEPGGLQFMGSDTIKWLTHSVCR